MGQEPTPQAPYRRPHLKLANPRAASFTTQRSQNVLPVRKAFVLNLKAQDNDGIL